MYHRTKLYRIVLKFACAGVITNEHDYVIETAPIFKWAIGKHINSIVTFYSKKGKLIECKQIKENKHGLSSW